MRFKIGILLLLFLFNLQDVSALEINNLEVTEEVWLNEDNMIYISFECSANANVSGNVTGAGYSMQLPSFTETPYINYSTYNTIVNLNIQGEPVNPYKVTVFCAKNSSQAMAEKYFSIYRLTALIAGITIPSGNPTDVIYTSDYLLIKVGVIENGQALTAGVNFSVSIDGRQLGLISQPRDLSNLWELEVNVPMDFEPVDNKPLRLNAVYNGHSVSTTSDKYLNVKPSLSVEIIDPSLLNPYRLTDTADINITVSVSYRSMPLSSSSVLDFEAKLNNNDLTIRNIEYEDPSNWIVSVNIPEMTPSNEKYYLDIFATYESIRRKSRSLPIQFVLLLEGNVVDADNSAVETEIRLKGSSIEEIISTDGSGYYRTEILPGEYEVELIFPDMRAKLSNVLISSSEDLFSTTHNVIRYDFFSGDYTKTFFLEFNLPFDNVYIVIPYKDSDFDENEIVVYNCKSWNFAQRSCKENWKKISADIDKVKNLISLELNSLSAFAINERNSLNLDVSLEKDHYAGDDVILTGNTLDNKNNTVSDVKINYSGAASGYIISDSSGRFTIRFKVPDSEGEHHLTLEAKKDTYISMKKTVSFNVIKKKSLLVTVPGSINIELGLESSIDIIVMNNGQVDLENIDISIENIPPRWYKLSKKRIDKLDIGRNSVVVMDILIDDCEDCKDQYDVLVRAENDVSTTNSFIINLNLPEEKSPVTGFTFLENSQPYLIIIVFIFLALLIYRKFNIKTGRKNSVLADLNEIKSEALGIKEEKPVTKEKNKPETKKEKKLKDILENPFK